MRLYPDWLMLGYRMDASRYAVMASSDLGAAELEAEFVQQILPGDLLTHTFPETRFHIRADARSYVIAYGESYASALFNLERAWSPPQPEPDPNARVELGPEPIELMMPPRRPLESNEHRADWE